MASASPTLPAAAIDYPQSEEELNTGERKAKKPEMLPDVDLLNLLKGYFETGREGRQSGIDPRDANWKANQDAYWSRQDTSSKAEWQAAEQMPEVANFVDRHTAALRMALLSQPNWFEIQDATEPSGERDKMMQKFVRIHLNHCTTNASGQRIGFDATFASAVKSGSMTVLAASVTYDPISGYVNVDPVNPFELFYDPTGRGLYRIRRTEIDRWQLDMMSDQEDSAGEKIYHAEAIERLSSYIDGEARSDRERQTGGSEQGEGGSRRDPITLDEYLCTIIDRDGKLIATNQLIVVANEQEIIRGPEDNPNWHGKDWIVMTPTVDVPFSVYGRTFLENFRMLAATFTETTNLMLDGMFAGAVGAHMVWEAALADPTQIAEGVHPGITVTADEDWPPGKDFVSKIDMGGIDPDSFRIWEALKAELREGASANELSLGQVPPKGDITAAEINASTSGSTVMQMGLAKDIDTRWLAPILELVLMTGLQHFDPEANPQLAQELGQPMSAMLAGHRQEFADIQYKYVAKGLTAAMERGQKVQGLTGALQVIGQNERLAASFEEKYSLSKLLGELLAGFDVDISKLKKDEQELRADKAAKDAARQAAAAEAGAPGAGGAGGPPPTGPGARGGAPIPRQPAI